MSMRLASTFGLALLSLACSSTVSAQEPTAPGIAAPQEKPDLRESEDVSNRVFAARIQEGKVTEFTATDLSRKSFSREPFKKAKRERPKPDLEPGKVHPLLQRWLKERPDDAELIVINFRDDFRTPRFPEPVAGESRKSRGNAQALRRADELVAQIRAKRVGGYKEIAETLQGSYEAKVVETFWLVKAVTVKMPLAMVPKLADRKEVMYLEPDRTEDKPSQDANANNNVQDGRARLNSDPYFGVGLTGGFIGLLDSGIRATHRQFTSPSTIAFRRDCVNGGNDCNTGAALNPNDDCWNHGTSSAAIITANARDGQEFRGVTGITLDSFKVYPSTFDASGNCTGNLSTTAAVRGFERAVAVLDRVIVAEMQGSGNYLSAVSVAADNAYDAGAVVIAANGNNGPAAATVNAPGSAHRVIGIGNFDVQTQTQVDSQSRGPTPTTASSRTCRPRPTRRPPEYGLRVRHAVRDVGTCGVPGVRRHERCHALRRGRGSTGAPVEGLQPHHRSGAVYAFLILSGQQSYPLNNTSGAGPIRLPTDGWAWWGKVAVNNRDTIDIPINVAGTPNRVDAAIRWPEGAQQFLFVTLESDNDVDLSLIDPGGTSRASSLSIPSVFERARVSGRSRPANGRWDPRLRCGQRAADCVLGGRCASAMRRRAAIACMLLVVPTVALSVARSRDSAGDGATDVIYADESWYRERPEPEQTGRERSSSAPWSTARADAGDLDLLAADDGGRPAGVRGRCL